MELGVRYEDAAAPEGMRLYAIGDIHGRADLLAKMLSLIEGEIVRDRPADWRTVYLGDYVDRGPDSAGVIEMIARRVAANPRHVALLGNHDKVLAEFLADPETWWRFADFEGETTARSYGVRIDFSSDAAIRQSREALLAAMPPAHIAFLNGLKLSAIFGDFFFCHAGIRPGVALDAQDPEDLIWIRREFSDYPGLHPKLVVHGHTPHHEPEIRANRVNLDTYAFASGRLTALAMEGREKRFLEVTG
ncbi:MAG: metallophosphoesterase family protein [Aliihoeflea sp.]|uniref:metallophosphoesterase family protein n=1 Tax=Aliihoeflea sp. TaxID=2608088 RepID=UPI0040333C82